MSLLTLSSNVTPPHPHFFFKNVFIFILVYECFAYKFLCACCVCSAHKGQKTDPLDLKLPIPSTYMACSGLVPWVIGQITAADLGNGSHVEKHVLDLVW